MSGPVRSGRRRSEARRHAVQFVETEVRYDEIICRVVAQVIVVDRNRLVVVQRDHGFLSSAILKGEMTEMTDHVTGAIFDRRAGDRVVGI